MSQDRKPSFILPAPIQAFFTADKVNAEAVARCFTENAVVKDEGRTFQGHSEILKWKSEATEKYTYASELLKCEKRNGRTIVTSRLTGNFPGSQIDLRFFFELEDDKISSLEIIV